MSAPKPTFRKFRGNALLLTATGQAKAVGAAPQVLDSKTVEQCHAEAKQRVTALGGDVEDEEWCLSQTALTFGKYCGQSFHWLLENDIGWTVRIMSSHKTEKRAEGSQKSTRDTNKDLLLRYVAMFPPVMATIGDRIEQDAAESSAAGDDSGLVGFGKYSKLTRAALCNSKVGEHLTYVRNFILKTKCSKQGSQMEQLQIYARTHLPGSSQQPSSIPTTSTPPRISTRLAIKTPPVYTQDLDDDEEVTDLEMLSQTIEFGFILNDQLKPVLKQKRHRVAFRD